MGKTIREETYVNMEIIDLSFINKLTITPKMELVGLQRIKPKAELYRLSERGSNAGVCGYNCDCVDNDCNCDCEYYDCADCEDCQNCRIYEDCDCDDCLDCDCPVDDDCDCADCVCNQYNCDCPDGYNCYDWDGCSDDWL